MSRYGYNAEKLGALINRKAQIKKGTYLANYLINLFKGEPDDTEGGFRVSETEIKKCGFNSMGEFRYFAVQSRLLKGKKNGYLARTDAAYDIFRPGDILKTYLKHAGGELVDAEFEEIKKKEDNHQQHDDLYDKFDEITKSNKMLFEKIEKYYAELCILKENFDLLCKEFGVTIAVEEVSAEKSSVSLDEMVQLANKELSIN